MGPAINVASVVPVGEVDVVIDKKCVRCTTQQGRKMPRHRGNQEDSRLRHNQVFFEVQQGAERRLMDRRLAHRDRPITDIDGVDAKGRPAVAQPRAGNQLAKGCDSPLEGIA